MVALWFNLSGRSAAWDGVIAPVLFFWALPENPMNAPTTPAQLQPIDPLRAVPQAFLDALAAHFGARCSTAMAVREQHGRDEGSRPHEPRAVHQCRRPDGNGAARHHAQAAQRGRERHRPVLSHRPRRRRQHRRHGGDACERYQRGALRHHARKRAGAGSRDRQRRSHTHRHARQEKRRRLRPHAPDGRQRGHAGCDH